MSSTARTDDGVHSVHDDIETGVTVIKDDLNVDLQPDLKAAVTEDTTVDDDFFAGKGLLKPIAAITPIEYVALCFACIAVGTSLASMIIKQSTVVIISGVLSSGIGLYAYYQQTRITDIRTLTETTNTIRNEIDRLENDTKRLQNNIDNLTKSVTKLEDIDTTLSALTLREGESVATFQEQVEDKKRILNTMKNNVKASLIQNVLSIMLHNDIDKDNIVDNNKNEIDALVVTIQKIVPPNVTLYEDRFRSIISGKSINSVMEIIKNLLRDDIPDDQRIFDFQEEQKLNQ